MSHGCLQKPGRSARCCKPMNVAHDMPELRCLKEVVRVEILAQNLA